MLTRVHHIGYTVSDLDRAISFYERTFGGRVVARGKSATSGGENAFVQSGSTMVELSCPADKGQSAQVVGQKLDHVGYQVEDIEAEIARLKGMGVRFATEKPTVNVAGWKLIYLDAADALGTRIHLTQV